MLVGVVMMSAPVVATVVGSTEDTDRRRGCRGHTRVGGVGGRHV